MTEKPALFVASMSWLLTVYFAVAGLLMRANASSPATNAVGAGLLVVAGALGITAFLASAVYADERNRRVDA